MSDDVKVEQPVVTGGSDEIEKAKGMAWLSYLGILFLIPMLTLKDNAFAKFHVKQGIMLAIFSVALSIVGGIIPFIGWFVLLPVGMVFALVLMIMGIINSAQGKYWTMPLLGKMAANWFKF